MKKVKPTQRQNKRVSKLSKRKSLGLSLILLCIVSIVAVVIVNLQPTKLKEESFQFEYGEDLPIHSSAYFNYPSSVSDEEFESSLFSMSDIGQYDINVLFHGEAYTIHLYIVDTTPPRISFVSGQAIAVSEYMDLDTIYLVEDSSEVEVSMSPSLTQLAPGNQEICIKAIDIYENTSEQCKSFEVSLDVYSMKYDPGDVQSVQEIVDAFRKKYQLNESNLLFFYYSPSSQEEYIFNEDSSMNAASTIKIALNMLYYDKLASGDIEIDSTIKYKEADTEVGDGIISTKYKPGDAIPLSTLLEQSIVNSDNTATNILIRNLGGFTAYRKLLDVYSDAVKPKDFYRANVISATYMLDVMKHLYANSQSYEQLIEYMKIACYGKYLQASWDYMSIEPKIEIAHKYGVVDVFQHDVGIVYTPNPYIIGIYTKDLMYANERIAELNEMIMVYNLKK